MAPVDRLDRNELAADFGGAYGIGLIMSTPELLVLAYQAQGWEKAYWDERRQKVVPGKRKPGVEWDAARIALEIPNTTWYQDRDANQREAENARLSDEGTWNTKVQRVLDSLNARANEIGADLTGVDINTFAESLLRDNYLAISGNVDGALPESTVDKFLAPYIKADSAGTFRGAAATNAASLRAKARQYGAVFTDQWYLKAVQDLQAGTKTQADLDMEIINSAKSRYPTLADGINETTSTYQLASTYIQTLADTLELDPESITLDTPEISKALSYIDPASGKPRLKSLYEFQTELRFDPRWENTTGGRKELSDLGTKLLKDWGFYQ